MIEYSEAFRFEAAVIGDTIEYLENQLESIIDSYTVQSTGLMEQEGEEWAAEVQELIDNLRLGTVGGRAFEMERQYRKNEAKVAQAWEEFRESHPEYFTKIY